LFFIISSEVGFALKLKTIRFVSVRDWCAGVLLLAEFFQHKYYRHNKQKLQRMFWLRR
jgi:hypothetical protein